MPENPFAVDLPSDLVAMRVVARFGATYFHCYEVSEVKQASEHFLDATFTSVQLKYDIFNVTSLHIAIGDV